MRECALRPRSVSIPLRKFRKVRVPKYANAQRYVSIPLRKFRKSQERRPLESSAPVSIPLRKFRKLLLGNLSRIGSICFHPSKEV